MTSQYNIRTGQPNADVTPDGVLWGFARTLEVARKKAAKLSKKIRSDCRVGIECNGVVIEQGDTAPFFTGSPRATSPIA